MEKKVYNEPEMTIYYIAADVICTSIPDNDVSFQVNDSLPNIQEA